MAKAQSTNKQRDFEENEEISAHKEIKTQLKEKCPMCLTFRSVFYCENCVNSGEFSSSVLDDNVNFAKKKKMWSKILAEKHNQAAECREAAESRTHRGQLPVEIRECSERIRILKQLIIEKREGLKHSQAAVESVREKNKTRETRLPRYRERVEKLATYVNTNMKSEIADRRARYERKKAQLKQIVQKNVENLIQFVFPIEKINPRSNTDDDSNEMINALAEASKTSFVRGTWVLMDSSGELHHRIVAPTLPGSGDYSAFLASDNETGVPTTEQIGSNEAYNIGAALCYTTQLVNLLSFYLDVVLPRKVNFADFCVKNLTERKFHRKIAWLNLNVLYLCFSQGMDTVLLNPKHTLNNILNLVQHADLGQTGPFQVDSGLLLSLECDGDYRQETDPGSDDEEDDHFPWEWEAIPLVPCIEGASGVTYATMTNTQAASAIGGGLVTSLASIFRGWAK